MDSSDIYDASPDTGSNDCAYDYINYNDDDNQDTVL